jgi:prepilin-type processing-associated H-X9-DG protein
VRILPYCEDLARYNKFRQDWPFGGDYGGYPWLPGQNRAVAYIPNSAYQCPSNARSLPTTPNTDYFGVSGGGQWTGTIPAGKTPRDGYPWFGYSWMSGNFYFANGAIVINGSIRAKDFLDGSSKQFMLAETRYQFTEASENAWFNALGSGWYVGKISRTCWACTGRSTVAEGGFIGSTAGAAVNGINTSDFVDTSAHPPSGCGTTMCAYEQLKTFGSYHPGGCAFALADGSVQFVAQTIDINLYRQLGSRADSNAGGLNQ